MVFSLAGSSTRMEMKMTKFLRRTLSFVVLQQTWNDVAVAHSFNLSSSSSCTLCLGTSDIPDPNRIATSNGKTCEELSHEALSHSLDDVECLSHYQLLGYSECGCDTIMPDDHSPPSASEVCTLCHDGSEPFTPDNIDFDSDPYTNVTCGQATDYLKHNHQTSDSCNDFRYKGVVNCGCPLYTINPFSDPACSLCSKDGERVSATERKVYTMSDKRTHTTCGIMEFILAADVDRLYDVLQEESFEDVFGVDDSVERGGREEESRYDGNRNGKGILTKSVFGRSERSSSVNSSNSEDSGNDTKKKRMFKFTRKNSKKKSQSPVRRTETSTSLTTTTPKSPSRKNLAKILHLRVQRKKAKSENTVENKARSGQSPSIQKPKLPRWKCVHDSKTGRVYYYHTLTRQVTWERPKGFVEWKVATLSPSGNQSNGELKEKDKALEKKFFYNVITKETRWDMPENFVQWKEVWDGRSEKCYYYNVLTRATTWNRPEGVVMDRNGEATEENENVRDGTDGKTNVTAEDITENVTNITTGASEGSAPFVATTVSNKSQSTTQKQQEIMDNSRGRSAEKLVGTNSMKVSLAAEKATSINPATSTQESNVEREESEKKGAVKVDKVDESHAKLAKLLSDYCPDEKENNSQLLKLAKGQETPIIVAIETLVEDTPFDELRLAIFSYVKATVIEMGEEPYDEKRRSGPRSSKFGSRPPLTKYVSHLSTSRGMKRAETYDTSSAPSAAYSLGSRAMSHMTGNSGSTMPINNTSNRSGGDIRRAVNLDKMVSDVDDKHKHVNDSKNIDVDNSADDIDTGDKLQNNSKILLDMKIVGDEKKKGDVLHNREERLTNRVQSPVQTLKHKSTANVGINLEVQSSCSSSLHLPSVNAETIESAYAGDCDDETDLGAWEEEDDVSALSDCFSLEKRTRPIKQKKVNSKKQSSYRKDTTRSPISHSDNADDLGKESRPYITKKIALKSSSQSETIQYTSFNPNKEESENSGGSGSIGYEEIPRANATVDVKTASARGHREVYSLSSWDDDTVTTNESDK